MDDDVLDRLAAGVNPTEAELASLRPIGGEEIGPLDGEPSRESFEQEYRDLTERCEDAVLAGSVPPEPWRRRIIWLASALGKRVEPG